MTNLQRLPEILFDILLTEWNGVKELTKLDTAFCNNQFRKYLVKSYERKTFTIALPTSVSGDALKWLFEKCIKPEGLLSFCSGSLWNNSPLSETVLDEKERLFSNVSAIKVSLGYRCAGSDCLDNEHEYIFKLIRFMNMCPLLRHLFSYFVHTFDYHALFMLMDQSILKSMTEFSLFGVSYRGISMAAVNHISRTCSKLTTLEMNICDWNEDDIVKLLHQHSSTLTTLCLAECPLTTRLGSTIIACLAPRIKKLRICTLRGDVNMTKFAFEVLSSCKAIENLHIFFQRPEEGKYNCRTVKVCHSKSAGRSVTLSDFAHDSFEHNEILTRLCVNNDRIALSNVFFLKPPRFMNRLITLNPNLGVFSISRSVLGKNSFELLRNLFERCSSLHTIHVADCDILLLSHNIVKLLSSLPRNVTTLLIGKQPSIDLVDLKRIVKSNPFLETLWFSDCCCDDSLFLKDYAHAKMELLACNEGTKFSIIDGLWELESLDVIEII
jgi:hypothetical protein